MKDIWIVYFKLLIILFINGLCVMWLWNAIIVSISNTPYINYWQSMGLCVLTNILFKPWGITNDKD